MANKNGLGPILTMTEAGRLVGRNPRVVKGWIDSGEVSNLGLKIGNQLYVRRLELERLITGPIDEAAAPRVTVVGPNGVVSRTTPEAAHLAIRFGAQIPDNDELSQTNYQRWLEKQEQAVTT